MLGLWIVGSEINQRMGGIVYENTELLDAVRLRAYCVCLAMGL